MGNCSHAQLIYSEQVSGSQNPNKETGIYRHPQFVSQLQQGFLNCDGERVQTIKDAWISAVSKNGKNKCLGSRKEKGETGEYISKSYEEVDKIVREIGSGIIKMGLSEIEGEEYKMIGIYGKNSEEWMLTDLAGNLFGVTSVAIYDTLGYDSIRYIMNQTQIKTIFTSTAMIDSILKQDKLDTVQFIVYFQNQHPITDQQLQALAEKGYKTIGLDILRQTGSMNLMDYPNVNSYDLTTISYTSGTTGDPKGVMLTQNNVLSTLGSLQSYDFHFLSSDVHLSYLPLAHIFERLISYYIILVGGYIGYFNGDVLKLKQDLQDLQPTIFASVPRLYNRFYDIIKQQFSNLQGLSSYIIEKGVESKLQNFKESATVKHSLYDSLAFHKTQAIFGGKVRIMITGSAPIQSDVIDFLKICACCQILEGYGQTESTGGSFITVTKDSQGGHVGGPVPTVEFKIQSVQEMDYLVTDTDAKGQPTPRGELLIRGHGVFKGYFKQHQKTQEVLDPQGWLYTGDIVRLNFNGSISIIDRKKNIFKLAQGEYVAAEKIEMLYRMLPYIEECFIYGDSLQAFLIIIIFPNVQELIKLAKNSKIELQSDDIKDLLENKQVKDLLLKQLSEKGKEMKLNGIEIPKKLHLIPKPFLDYDCLTTSFKLKRHHAKKVFQKEITQMYES